MCSEHVSFGAFFFWGDEDLSKPLGSPLLTWKLEIQSSKPFRVVSSTFMLRVWDAKPTNYPLKSAHTALAVKACLLGGNSNTKCSMTFVNIAVAISALAGGAQKRFRTETRIRWCFRHFSKIFGCLSARGYWNGILGHFGSFPAMEKRPKMKKNIVHSKILQGFWMPEHWKHCKNKCFGLTL